MTDHLPPLPEPDPDTQMALRIAELWSAGKMIGGDEDYIRDKLLTEVKRRGDWGQQCYEAGVLAERERCLKVTDAKRWSIAASNTFRGKLNSVGSFAVGLLDDCAAAIRKG